MMTTTGNGYFQAWDDVERKVKQTDEVYEYKKKIVLDQEKSKLSLSQLYEQEYLKQKQVCVCVCMCVCVCVDCPLKY